MIKICFIMIFSTTFSSLVMAQEDELPFRQIPDAPEDFTAGNVAARVVDGLGFRYYWATEDLRPEDLDYRPSADGRTIRETLEHIYGLSLTINIAAQNKVNYGYKDTLSFEDLRKQTLLHLQQTSRLLKDSKGDEVSDMQLRFKRGENTRELPFWNLLNGPIADALYHTGQVVAFRRAAGNPMPAGVDVLIGKKSGD